MSEWTLYHNPNCTKSRQAKELLKDKDVTVIEYLKTPPSKTEIKTILNQLVCDPKTLVRVKEKDYIDNPFNLDDFETIAENLANKPKLFERPTIIHQGKALIGRPISILEDYLKELE